MIPETIAIDGRDLAVWPADQRFELLAAPNMGLTDFADCEHYHPQLIASVLELEHDPRYRDTIFKGGCGQKVRDPGQWGRAEAQLVEWRALAFAVKAFGTRELFVDEAWANIYRTGDYCAPHSHLRAVASLVYLVDPGDPVQDDPLGGRLCFGDPRIPFCCDFEPGRMTRMLMPDLRPGSLLIFPAEFVHSVNPYGGVRPRITMSWNISLERLPGTPGEGWKNPREM